MFIGPLSLFLFLLSIDDIAFYVNESILPWCWNLYIIHTHARTHSLMSVCCVTENIRWIAHRIANKPYEYLLWPLFSFSHFGFWIFCNNYLFICFFLSLNGWLEWTGQHICTIFNVCVCVRAQCDVIVYLIMESLVIFVRAIMRACLHSKKCAMPFLCLFHSSRTRTLQIHRLKCFITKNWSNFDINIHIHIRKTKIPCANSCNCYDIQCISLKLFLFSRCAGLICFCLNSKKKINRIQSIKWKQFIR